MSEVEELVACARSLFERGYCFGTSGNISLRIGDRVFSTPTGSSMGSLTEESIAVTSMDGTVLGASKPTKELHFHLAAYRALPDSRAVVHLHSTYATAISCLRDLDLNDALPVLTPYYAMRIPALPVVPYLPPGDLQLAAEVEQRACTTPAMLLRNHGSVAIGKTLRDAVTLAEEIEEAARLYLLLGDRGLPLTPDQVLELRRRFR